LNVSRSVLRKFVEKIKTHILVNNFFFEHRAFYETMWKNIVEPERPRKLIWRMRIACCINKATSTHSEYVMLLAISRQEWLHERASMLRCTCMAYIATFFF